MKIIVYADPGHAWAKVSRKLLIKLGIESEISRFSFQRGDFCYLEEDGDLSLLVSKLKEQNINYSFKVNNSNKRSRIRNYYSYQSQQVG